MFLNFKLGPWSCSLPCQIPGCCLVAVVLLRSDESRSGYVGKEPKHLCLPESLHVQSPANECCMPGSERPVTSAFRSVHSCCFPHSTFWHIEFRFQRALSKGGLCKQSVYLNTSASDHQERLYAMTPCANIGMISSNKNEMFTRQTSCGFPRGKQLTCRQLLTLAAADFRMSAAPAIHIL